MRRPRFWRAIGPIGIAYSILDYGMPSRADEPVGTTAAEALFEAGKASMLEGRYGDACPKLAASNQLAPAVGNLLHLGLCYERMGAPASAWQTYREAEGRALGAHDKDRAQLAAQRARQVEPLLSRITIRVETPAACGREHGTRVVLDGRELPLAALDVAIPIDPGNHKLEAQAEGCLPFVCDLAIGSVPAESVVVAELTVEQPDAGVPNPQPVGEANPLVLPARDGGTPKRHTEPLRSAMWISGAAGVASLATGTLFGALAWAHMDEARGLCNGRAAGCPADALSMQNRASRDASLSTAFLIGGALASAVALVILWRTSKTSSSHQP